MTILKKQPRLCVIPACGFKDVFSMSNLYAIFRLFNPKIIKLFILFHFSFYMHNLYEHQARIQDFLKGGAILNLNLRQNMITVPRTTKSSFFFSFFLSLLLSFLFHVHLRLEDDYCECLYSGYLRCFWLSSIVST